MQQIGLCEALGMPELGTAIESIKEILPWLRDVQPKAKIERDSVLRRLEDERTRLQNELISAEKRGEEREIVKKQKDEIRALESQLLEARRREVDNSLLLSRQVSNLEEKLTFERDSRLLSISELDQNKMKYDKVLKELNKLKSSPNLLSMQSENQRSEILAAYSEADKYKLECQNTVAELKAVEHHRGILRETVEQLERQIRIKSDALADSQRFPSTIDAGIGKTAIHNFT